MRQASRLKQVLEMEIVTGQIRPGDRLEELDIANRFGVSRTPVREALFMLEAIDLVERKPNHGTIVRGFSLRRLVQMLEALAELEALLARLAARRGSSAELDHLQAVLTDYLEIASETRPDETYDANIRFHRALYAAAGNDELLRMTEAIAERMEPFLRAQHHSSGWIDKSIDEHQQIVAAIQQGDGDRAHALVLSHVHVDSNLLAEFSSVLPE